MKMILPIAAVAMFAAPFVYKAIQVLNEVALSIATLPMVGG